MFARCLQQLRPIIGFLRIPIFPYPVCIGKLNMDEGFSSRAQSRSLHTLPIARSQLSSRCELMHHHLWRQADRLQR